MWKKIVYLFFILFIIPLHSEQKRFTIITASYNNSQWYEWSLNSVITQTYSNWRMIYIDDCSTDETANLVEIYIKKNNLENKIQLIRNKIHEGNPLANHYKAIHNLCKDDEIMVILDGDDALAHPHVLQTLNTTYQNSNIWLTYGQFMEYPSGEKGFCCSMPQEVVTQNAFRYFVHIPSHLRSFYACLFKAIKKEDLFYNGNFFPMTGDMAAMIPMIEMARNHFLFIPEILYLYNAQNPLNEHKQNKILQQDCDRTIRLRQRYTPLLEKPPAQKKSIPNNLFTQKDYQDIIINGQVVKKGIRNCEPTYQAIQKILNRYQRSLTVLDLGAAQGYFSFKIAAEYDATTVMIENSINYPLHNKQLLKLCELNDSLENIIFLQTTITPENLLRLGECEHFDVILALNFIHHCMHPWKEIIDALLTLGENIIIEHPPWNDDINQAEKKKRADIEEYLIAQEAEVIAEVPRHHTSAPANAKVFLIKQPKTSLKRRHWCWPPPYGTDKKEHHIISTYHEKKISKTNGHAIINSEWHKGINLMTFKMLQGVFPTKAMLKNAIIQIQDFTHQDWTPSNLIVQGSNLQLIDYADFHYLDNLKKNNESVQKQTKRLIDIDQPASVYNYFWYHMFPRNHYIPR